jgi:hypothetical protein
MEHVPGTRDDLLTQTTFARPAGEERFALSKAFHLGPRGWMCAGSLRRRGSDDYVFARGSRLGRVAIPGPPRWHHRHIEGGRYSQILGWVNPRLTAHRPGITFAHADPAGFLRCHCLQVSTADRVSPLHLFSLVEHLGPARVRPQVRVDEPKPTPCLRAGQHTTLPVNAPQEDQE